MSEGYLGELVIPWSYAYLLWLLILVINVTVCQLIDYSLTQAIYPLLIQIELSISG